MASTREPSLQEVLCVEDDAELLGFHCGSTHLPLWPQIRIAFFRMLMSDLLYGTPITGSSTANPPIYRAAATMTRSVVRNLGLRVTGRCRADICITTDGVANQWVNGQWFNRLADHFGLACADETLMVEDHFEWRWPFPRQHQRTMLHAPLQAINAVAGRVTVRTADFEQARGLVDLVSLRSRRLLGWTPGDARAQYLVTMLARKSAALPLQYLGYRRLLDRVRPKLLLVGAACYGPLAALLAAARDAGVFTAEYQHGAVSAGHDAYNFAPALRQSADYQRTLPHCFLGFGRWWNDQINAPVEKIIIGNPHREARLSQAATARDDRPKADLLLLSDGIEFESYLGLARQILPVALCKGMRVVVRPHPLERSAVTALHGAHVGDVLIDPNADLYASLRTAHTVVSEVSTGLFDAVGMADKLLMWDTAKSRFGFPVHPFQSFGTALELIELIEDDASGRFEESRLDGIWAPNWKRNYTTFLAAQGVARCA